MGHLFLLGIFLNLIVGACVIVYFFQISRSFPFPFLNPMAWHLILFNGALFILLMFEYLEVNIPSFINSKQYILYFDLGYLGVYFLLNGIVFVMARIMTAFLEIRFKSFFSYGFITGFILILFSFCMKTTFSGHISLGPWTKVIYYYLLFLFFSLEVLLLIILMVRAKKQIPGWKRLIHSFAIINLSHYMVLAFIFAFPKPILIHFGYLYFNLSPLFWLLVFFLKYARNIANQAESMGILDVISIKHKISKREKEIMQLILMGKSNSEIKDELFISYHTVKNHLYSLYNKLSIKSRYELIYMFNRYLANGKESG